MYKLGIDIGSTTVKVVVLDDSHKILFSDYRRHYANIKETLQSLINDAKARLGDVEVTPAITGSGGLALAEVITKLSVMEGDKWHIIFRIEL